MMFPHYQDVIKEYSDMSDRKSLKILTSLNESDQNKALVNITNKLYESIIDKITDIDFGEIPKTRGDITKLSEYDKIVDVSNLLRDLLIEYKQSTEPIDTVIEATRNVVERKNTFEMAYKLDMELPIAVYQTIVLSIISSISLLISSSIDYIKEPASPDFKIVVDKVSLNKSKDALLFNNLQKFNRSCKNGKFDDIMDHVLKSNAKNMTGIVATFTIAQGVTVAALALMLIPMLRELIYFFYYSRVRMGDYLETQSELLTMNAYRLSSSEGRSDADIKKITDKQTKIADKLRKMANLIQVSNNKAEKDTQKQITKVSKKYKADEIFEDDVPDSASALF